MQGFYLVEKPFHGVKANGLYGKKVDPTLTNN
jgi:hypothetical protein